MAPIYVIWLYLVKIKPLPATFWLPSHPVEALVVLATPVKILPKMVGNSASYLHNSW